MKARFLAAPAFVALVLAGSSPAGASASAATPPSTATEAVPHVIVVGAAGLAWSDVGASRTPSLWRLAGVSALGSLSVKAADPVSCPDDGWLTLGAGNRAAAAAHQNARCASSALAVSADAGASSDVGTQSATVAGFAGAYDRNESSDDATHLGALADVLEDAGECVSAAGAEAALGAADSKGRVSSYRANAAAAAGDPAFLARCAVTLIAATLSNVDEIVALVSERAPEGSELLVVGVSETSLAKAHLHVALASGPDFRGGSLVSASTRRTPFVQLVDVAPTVLALRGAHVPNSMIGEPWRQSGGNAGSVSSRVRGLARLDLAAQRQSAAIVAFWVSVVAVMVLACLLAWWVARRRRPGPAAASTSAPLARLAALACVWCALLPAASFLADAIAWSRPPSLLPLMVSTAIAATVLSTIAVGLSMSLWRGNSFGLAGAVGLLTFAVIGLDLVTGGHLQIFTMAGYSPLVAGRFAGIGNVAFGVFAAGALLAAAGVGDMSWVLATDARRRARRLRPATVAVVGLGILAVVADGAPPWGSDVGGVLSLVPAVAVLAWLLAGFRVSWGRAVAVAALAVAVIVVFGLVDYSRPSSSQTHLGRFVGEVMHGGAWTIVRRKAHADVHLLTYSALTLLVPVMVLVAIWLLRWPRPALRHAFERAPALRPALVSIIVMCVIGAVVNDSGVAIPALAVLVALPATMAVVVTPVRHSRDGGVRADDGMPVDG